MKKKLKLESNRMKKKPSERDENEQEDEEPESEEDPLNRFLVPAPLISLLVSSLYYEFFISLSKITYLVFISNLYQY